MIDTVFNVLEFKNMVEKHGIDPTEVRICVRKLGRGEFFYKIEVIVTVGVYRDEVPWKILRCVVGEKTFSVADEEKYREWVNRVLEEAYGLLGFKPVEGYWMW